MPVSADLICKALKPPLNVFQVLILDVLGFLFLIIRSNMELRADNLFLRKQLAFCEERKLGHGLILVLLSRFFAWDDALVIVKPEPLIRWHRKGFRLFWRWKSKRRRRPGLPIEIQKLIQQMAEQDVTWSEEPIATEPLLKIGIRVSPRALRSYMPHHPRIQDRAIPSAGQHWSEITQRLFWRATFS